MKAISNGTPKALMPIGDSVFLDLILKKVFKYKILNVYLSLHYNPKDFTKHIDNSIYEDKIITVVEPEPLGTGGAINYILKKKDISDTFFVINGDTISDIDLDMMSTKFINNNLTAMIGVSKVFDAERYGSVSTNNGKVTSFNEKGISGPGWINNGYYIFKKKTFSKLHGSFSLEKKLFPSLVNSSELGVFQVLNDDFLDIGTPIDYEKIKKGNYDYENEKNNS